MATASVKPYRGMGMEGFVARWYAANTRKGMEEYRALARRVADELPAGSTVLELAPGPGYFAIELAKLEGYCITGLDISRTFVEIARSNGKLANVQVDFRQGNASSMPFESKSFDFLFCRAAFKNFSEPVRALQEMWRVLKAGGKALIIDLRRDASRESIRRLVDSMDLSPFSAVMTRLTFRFVLLRRAYTRNEFEQFLAQTQFREVDIRENDAGLEIRLGR